MTNYHLVTAEIANYRREAGVVAHQVPCRSLRAQVAKRNGDGAWEWRDAESLWLVSHPPQARAVWQDESGSSHLKEDTALLRVEPCPSMHLELSAAPAVAGDRVWMAGFPLRSARSIEALRAIGYRDADGGLRVSAGEVLAGETTAYFTTDLDGSMGNSGSPVMIFDTRSL